jgi:hypothetical protein
MEYRIERTVGVGKRPSRIVDNAIDVPRTERRGAVRNVKAKVRARLANKVAVRLVAAANLKQRPLAPT